MFPAFVARMSWTRYTGTVRPICSIMVAGLGGTLLTLLDFDTIVQLYLVSRVINLWILYASLIRLRYTEPDTPRPYKIPGGLPVLIAIFFPTVAISIFALYFANWQVWAAGGSAEVVIIGTYFLRMLWLKRWPEADSLVGELPEKGEKGISEGGSRPPSSDSGLDQASGSGGSASETTPLVRGSLLRSPASATEGEEMVEQAEMDEPPEVENLSYYLSGDIVINQAPISGSTSLNASGSDIGRISE